MEASLPQASHHNEQPAITSSSHNSKKMYPVSRTTATKERENCNNYNSNQHEPCHARSGRNKRTASEKMLREAKWCEKNYKQGRQTREQKRSKGDTVEWE